MSEASKAAGVSFIPSGKLAEEANTVNGTVLKYGGCLESALPDRKWRLYIFKGDESKGMLLIIMERSQ